MGMKRTSRAEPNRHNPSCSGQCLCRVGAEGDLADACIGAAVDSAGQRKTHSYANYSLVQVYSRGIPFVRQKATVGETPGRKVERS